MALCLLSPFNMRGEIEGTWTPHYTFHRLAAFAPAPGRIYMLVHPQEYKSGAREDIGTVAATVFYADDPASPIRHISELAPLSGRNVKIMKYNPAAGYLFLGYTDGKMDLVRDDGNVREVDILSRFSTPGKRSLHDVTFSPDGRYAYVATDFGYVKVSSDDASAGIVNLGSPLNSVAPVGKSILLLFADGSLLEGDVSATSIHDFYPLSVDTASDNALLENGGVKAPITLLPLSDIAFCYLIYNDGKPILAAGIKRDGKWHFMSLAQDSFRFTPSSMAINSMGDNDGVANRDGYYFHTSNHGYLVRRNADFSASDDDIRKNALGRYYKAGDSGKESASWDMSQYWFYNEREGIYSRRLEGDNWLGRSEIIVPAFPSAHISDEIAWHPTRGLILQNHGVSYDFPDTRTSVPSTLCGLKDGVWTNYSPAWNIPRFTESSADLKSAYNSGWARYPTSYPRGVELDPDNPDFVYSGSMKGGMLRFNLADPKGNILHLTHPEDAAVKAGYPGYVKVCETMEWSEHCSFTTPRADAEGRLWSLYYDYNSQRAGKQIATLRYWTREDRLASEKANDDPSLFRQWNTITIPGFKCSNFQLMLPLRNKVNANLIIAASNNFQDPIYVWDHRGTLSDISDDRIAVIKNIIDSEGASLFKDHVYFMKEDPASGMVWVGTDSGVFYFSPATSFRQPGLVVRPRPYDPQRGCPVTLLEGVLVRDMSFDKQGRKWFATKGSGVVCLSADHRTIEGHWNTANTSIPSDNVYAVGCDLADGTVLVSTDAGLAEFIPSGTRRNVAGVIPRAYPQVVEPGFTGSVEMRNLPASPSYAVVDETGEVVRELPASDDGILRWDTLTRNGKRSPTGRYYITLLSDTSIHYLEIIVLSE